MSNPMQRLLSGAQQGRQIMQTPSNPTGAMSMPGGNTMQMMQQFAQFKRLMQGRNPQAMVQQLLDSGQMSQAQFAQLKSMASSMRDILR